VAGKTVASSAAFASVSMEIFGPRSARIFHLPGPACVIFVFHKQNGGKSALAASGKNNNFQLQFGSVLRRGFHPIPRPPKSQKPTPKSPTAIATAIFRSQVTNIRGVFIAN